MTVRVGETVLNLVCGPEGPLPDSSSRYRLLAHLGTGGQAEVYRGVRISAGLRSSPVTVKVFRAADHTFSRAEQLGFWDKGDAVLMDLNSRGTPGICLRVDGFYGAPPRAEDVTEIDNALQQVPFQVLDYLPGSSLIDRLRDDVHSGGGPSLNGLNILRTLATTLRALHHPADDDLAVLHMDVKPANVLIGPDGRAHLIDFTASRYHNSAHLTSVAHSPESGGPEAKSANRQIGPAYDVHGFGAVAYYLATGWHPRSENEHGSQLRVHPLLDHQPLLARHLMSLVADDPADRPATTELPGWIARFGDLMRGVAALDHLVSWSEPAGETAVSPMVAVPARRNPTETATLPVLSEEMLQSWNAGAKSHKMRGSARIPDPLPIPGPPPQWHPSPYPQSQPPPPPQARRPPMAPFPRARGRGLLAMSMMWFLLCWVIWLATDYFRTQSASNALLGLVFASVGAFGVYWLTRLAGYLVRSTLELQSRRSVFIPNLTTGIFLLTCGISVLSFTPLDIRRLIDLFTSG